MTELGGVCLKSEPLKQSFQLLPFLSQVPEDEVEADDGFGLRRLAVVEDGGLSFCPNKSATVGQETVVAGVDLTFGQHCMQRGGGQQIQGSTLTHIGQTAG